ncbi:MAG: sulfatase-like hydrolase/transferase [Tissierellia bacterium]|jgi:arylsulfatase A-like enzyme|nr:sulfatase-like hydrolase/transferase [Tissierellia bacterium]
MYFGYFEVVRSERGLLLYLFLSTIFMEIILRWQSGQAFFGLGLFFMVWFALAFVLVSMGILHLVPRPIGRILIRIWFVLITLLFVVQFVYFSIFKTYLTFYSMMNGTKAFSFYKIIIIYMLRDLRWLLLFLPLLLFLFIGSRLIWVPRGGAIDYGLLFVLNVLVLATLLGMTNRADLSPVNILASSNEPVVGVHNLGIIGNAYGEIKRQLMRQKNPYYPPEETIVPRSGENVAYDLGKFLEQESDPITAEITSYLLSRKPTAKNTFTGRLAGYNLIYVAAESFSHWAVDENLTPTLHRLMEGGVQFENFYNPIWGVSTTDAEYAALTGLLPVSGIWSMAESRDNLLPQAYGNQFNRLGYHSNAFHNHDHSYYKRDKTHGNLGYNFYGLGAGLELEKTWPESDQEMIEKSLPFYIDKEPFHTYYLTVSGHMPYDFVNNAMSKKHQDKVENLPLSEEAKAYIACNIELDQAMETLVQALEDKGLMDKTLIVLQGDHYPYGLKKSTMEELAGKELVDNEIYRSRIIFYTPSLEGVRVRRLSTALDLLPTLSNLFGLEYDSRLMMGRDLFSYSFPMVEFVTGSFMTPQGYYDNMRDKSEGYTQEELKELRIMVEKKYHYSRLILESDYYRKIEPYRIKKPSPSGAPDVSEEEVENPDELIEDDNEYTEESGEESP